MHTAFKPLGLTKTVVQLTAEIRELYLEDQGAVGPRLLWWKRLHGKKKLAALEKIDWSRGNAKVWEGRALIGGKVSKVTTNVVLTTNVVKNALGLQLDAEEQKVEAAHNKRN
jgi:DNA sulfur modification protein DndB